MTVSRKVFELWQACQTRNPRIDVFRDGNSKVLLELPEYGIAYDSLQNHTDNPHMAIILSLRSLEIQRSELADKLSDTELALTVPTPTCTSARPTMFVIREMIESAQREVLIAGYRITDSQIIRLLWNASSRGVRVCILCGRADGDAQVLKANWPTVLTPPKIYQDIDRGEANVWSLMHIKTLIVDSIQLLVSSANFTAGGMQRNIEFGIRTTGRPASDAKSVLSQLLRGDYFEEVV